MNRYEAKPIIIDNKRWDPVTGLSSAAIGTYSDMLTATAGILIDPVKEYRRNRRSPSASRAESPQPPSAAESSERANSVASSGSKEEKSRNTAGAMAVASGKSLGKVFGAYSKGATVDIPLALAEGLRAVPGYWGEEVRDHDKIKDWESRAIVAGKTFAYGMGEGLTDIFVQPYKGGKQEGVLGVVKGVGKGSVSLLTKTGSAAVGLLAYPGQGIARSIYTAAHSKTRKQVVKAALAEGEWVVKGCYEDEHIRVRDAYNALQRSL